MEAREDGLQVMRDSRDAVPGQQIVPAADVDEALAELASAVDRDLSAPDLAPATERAYAHNWADFAAFCTSNSLAALPAVPQTLALYLKSLETVRSRAPSAYRRQPPAEWIISVSQVSRCRPFACASPRSPSGTPRRASRHRPTNPLVRRMLRRYARTRGTAAEKKEPLTIDRLSAIVAAMPDDAPALRDRALILLGYAGAFRRSELVALDVDDLRFTKKGVNMWIAGAKNDPRRAGRELTRLGYLSNALTYARSPRASAGLRSWGRTGRLSDVRPRGRLTGNRLDPSNVARVLRRRAAAAGVVGDFVGHSLRRSFITNAAKKKIPIESIKRVAGQRSNAVVLDYVAAATLDDIRRSWIWRDNR